MTKVNKLEVEKEILIAIINCKYKHNNIPTNGQLTDAIVNAIQNIEALSIVINE